MLGRPVVWYAGSAKLPPLFEDEDEDYSELISLDKLKIAAGPPAPTDEPGKQGFIDSFVLLATVRLGKVATSRSISKPLSS